MSRAPLAGLGLVAAVLAGTIAWQLDSGEAAPSAWAAVPERAAVAAPVVPPGRVADPAAISLARPLFSPDRRPPGPGAAPQQEADAPLPRLTGILVTAEGRSAMFAGTPQALLVREGGIVGRYTVRSIEPGLVTLHGPDGPRTLRPSFDPARPVQAAARPRVDEGLPPAPGPSPALAEGPKDDMPFEQKPTPSGRDIIRNQARRSPTAAAVP